MPDSSQFERNLRYDAHSQAPESSESLSPFNRIVSVALIKESNMAQEILVYPDLRIREISQDVNVFNEELFELIDEMKAAMEANNADGLAAIQIGYKAKVVLVKDEKGEILELVNARITEAEDSGPIEETTLYYPGITVNINRFNKIKVSYQDRNGTFRSLRPSAKLGHLIQRKVDYTFSATSIQKVTKEERTRIEKLLEKESGPSQSSYAKSVNYRDYLYKAINYLLILGFASLVLPLFVDADETLQQLYFFEQLLSSLMLVLIITYFFYARYEAKQQKVCSSCQTTNIVTISAVSAGLLALFFTISYFWINPS